MRMLVLGAGLQGSACAWDLLRNPAAKKEAWEDLQQVMAELGLSRPGRAPERACRSGPPVRAAGISWRRLRSFR